MTASPATLWWLAAGALVVAELLSGTFYLLMIALGAAAGAVAAHAGLPVNGQFASAALIGGGAVALWHLRRSRGPKAARATANPDVLLDIGSTVQVALWLPDGTARVQYRGAAWDARHVGPLPPTAGEHVIRSVEGSRLLLERLPG